MNTRGPDPPSTSTSTQSDRSPADVAPGGRAPEPGREASGTTTGTGPARISWRRNLYALAIAQLLATMAFSLRVPFLPFFIGELGVESVDGQALWAGVISAGGAGVMAIFAPIWGSFADKYGRKPMLMRAQFCSFVTIGLMILATEVWHLLALRLIEGALAGTVTAATALVAVSMPKDRLGFGLGIIQTAVFSGTAAGPLLGGFLADLVGYRAAFGVSSFMLLGAGVITWLFVQEHFVRPEEPEANAPKPVSIWRIAAAPALAGLVLVMLAVRFATGAVRPIEPLFISELGHTANAAATAGIAMGVVGITSAISSVFLGRLGDRRGHHPVLLVCIIGSGIMYLPMAASQAPWQLIVFEAIFGLFAGGTIPSANALIANMTPEERRGAIYGVVAAASSVGGFLGPLVGSGIAAGVGFRATFVLTSIVLLIVGGWVTWTAHRGRRQDTAPPPDSA